MRTTLALAVLTRNNERSIARCLESVEGVVDQVYVLDTGSEDGTVALARMRGAIVKKTVWPDRFDVAFNALFGLVTEDWTLRLDADEWLLPGSGEVIRGVIESAPIDLFYMTRVDEHPDGSTSEMVLPRLARTACRIRMKGRIHDHFDPADLEGKRVAEIRAKFGHDGFAVAAPEIKQRRNLNLLREEVAENPDSLYFNIELARTLSQLGEPEGPRLVRALADHLLELQHLEEMPEPVCGDLLASALDAIPAEEYGSARTEGLIRLTRGWCSRLPGATWSAAQIQLRRGRLREAMDCLLDLEHMFLTNDYQRFGGFQRGTIERATWQNLALVAHQLGRLEIAKRNYQRWLQLEPLNEQARQNLNLL